MKTIIINGRDFLDEERMHEVLKEKLGFPDYYGNNFDALNDCLSGWDKNEHIVLYNFSDAYEQLGRDNARILVTIMIGAFSEEHATFMVCNGELADLRNLIATI